jgi:hypothetical protein
MPKKPTTPTDYKTRLVKAYLSDASLGQLARWKKKAFISPQNPSNGDLLNRLIWFGVSKGFDPTKTTELKGI